MLKKGIDVYEQRTVILMGRNSSNWSVMVVELDEDKGKN